MMFSPHRGNRTGMTGSVAQDKIRHPTGANHRPQHGFRWEWAMTAEQCAGVFGLVSSFF